MFDKLSAFSSGFKDGMVVMLNASGSALVSMYDKSVSRANRVRSSLLPTEKNKLELAIREQTTKIHSLQYEIGRESARDHAADSTDALELRANIARVRDCENNIVTMKRRLAEIEEEKKIAKALKQQDKKAKKSGNPTAVPSTTLETADSPVIVTSLVEGVAKAADVGEVVVAPVTSDLDDTVKVRTGRSKKEVGCSSDDSNKTDSVAA